MNERIKELKEQARDFYLNQEDLDWSPQELHNAVEAKFAELIVEECAGICEEHHAWTARMVGNQIKDHFGVE